MPDVSVIVNCGIAPLSKKPLALHTAMRYTSSLSERTESGQANRDGTECVPHDPGRDH
jgi:hypothetical protein